MQSGVSVPAENRLEVGDGMSHVGVGIVWNGLDVRLAVEVHQTRYVQVQPPGNQFRCRVVPRERRLNLGQFASDELEVRADERRQFLVAGWQDRRRSIVKGRPLPQRQEPPDGLEPIMAEQIVDLRSEQHAKGAAHTQGLIDLRQLDRHPQRIVHIMAEVDTPAAGLRVVHEPRKRIPQLQRAS